MLFLNYSLINTNVGMSKDNAKTVMLTPENIVVLRTCVYSASKLLIFAMSTQKGYSILFLGPSLYRAVGIGTTVKQNIIGLSLTRKKTKASNQ